MELHLNDKSMKINNHDIRRETTAKRDSRKEIVIIRKQSNEVTKEPQDLNFFKCNSFSGKSITRL